MMTGPCGEQRDGNHTNRAGSLCSVINVTVRTQKGQTNRAARVFSKDSCLVACSLRACHGVIAVKTLRANSLARRAPLTPSVLTPARCSISSNDRRPLLAGKRPRGGECRDVRASLSRGCGSAHRSKKSVSSRTETLTLTRLRSFHSAFFVECCNECPERQSARVEVSKVENFSTSLRGILQWAISCRPFVRQDDAVRGLHR